MKERFNLKKFAETMMNSEESFMDFFENFRNWMRTHGELERENGMGEEEWSFGDTRVAFIRKRFANSVTEGGWAFFVKFNDGTEWFHHEYDE